MKTSVTLCVVCGMVFFGSLMSLFPQSEKGEKIPKRQIGGLEQADEEDSITNCRMVTVTAKIRKETDALARISAVLGKNLNNPPTRHFGNNKPSLFDRTPDASNELLTGVSVKCCILVGDDIGEEHVSTNGKTMKVEDLARRILQDGALPIVISHLISSPKSTTNNANYWDNIFNGSPQGIASLKSKTNHVDGRDGATELPIAPSGPRLSDEGVRNVARRIVKCIAEDYHESPWLPGMNPFPPNEELEYWLNKHCGGVQQELLRFDLRYKVVALKNGGCLIRISATKSLSLDI